MELEFAIDRGGTFTDLIARIGDRFVIKKVLSDSPHYKEACSHAIKEVLNELSGIIDPSRIEMNWIRMGTTVATNALLERKGEPVALLVTEGFGDILYIADQTRPDIFALEISKEEPIFECVVEVKERVLFKEGKFIVDKPLDEKALRDSLSRLDVKNLAICFVHAYGFVEHERKAAEIARSMGFDVVCSHETVPLPDMLARTQTTLVDAYLTPVLKTYLKSFQNSFSKEVAEKTLMMQSSATLCSLDEFRGSRALLSGPAGGVLALESLYDGTPLIGFDMGGTSTDVCRFDGAAELRYEMQIAGVKVCVPQVDLHTVASGGGSRLFYRNSLFSVGPQSSGADPGPLCYGRNGFLSLTDANLVTGRLDPLSFAHIFGPNGDAPLNIEAARKGFEHIAKENGCSIEEVAEGFREVANEQMASAIGEVTLKKGFDPSAHILCSFGGAGGQHAVAVAARLGISKVLIHRYAGILSAYGMALARRSFEAIKHLGIPLEECSPSVYAPLEKRVTASIPQSENIVWRRFVSVRYEGTDHLLEVPFESAEEEFKKRYFREFGFSMPERGIVAESIRVEATLVSKKWERRAIKPQIGEPIPIREQRLYQNGKWCNVPVYRMDDLGSGAVVVGPSLVIQETSTVVIESGCRGEITEYGDLSIAVKPHVKRQNEKMDAVKNAVFSNRFGFIASRMGEMLKKSAVSTNIKERLDFSCAIFDPKGNLIANAPHIPVHLGSMGSVVRAVMQKFPTPQAGESYISNAPFEGGSHLPDITVVTPCIKRGEVLFWTASRGHHADIGGCVPGSMPPFSVTLAEEGALFEAFALVREGLFAEEKVRDILKSAGARRIEDNISDFRAQIGANTEGIALMLKMMDECGKTSVLGYMESIMQISEEAVREYMKSLHKKTFYAKEMLDCGIAVVLKVEIDDDGGALFDFSGSGLEVWGNQNAPEAVVRSAVMYAVRAMLRKELPLNEGIMAPIRLKLTKGSILSPSADAAVAGGNVTTSQRIVDVVLKAFGEAAGSQGCMNNISFGNEKFGYYETVAGGAGATAFAKGADGIHTHMTNTRITDVEVLERRYPVCIERFELRKDSGGAGRKRGGEGIVRIYRMLEPLTFSILSERRVFAPFGLKGGEAGKKGENILLRNGRMYSLGSKIQIETEAEDRIIIKTPGGGGYGARGKRC